VAMAPRHWPTSRTTPRTLSLERFSSGSAGSVSIIEFCVKHLLTFTIGFNGGSALAANLRAAQACIVTNLAASVGGLTWMLWVRQ